MIKKMNWEKGLIRLYVLWSLGWLIYVGWHIFRVRLELGSFFGGYYKGNYVSHSETLSLIILPLITKPIILTVAPWVLHLPVKWAINGFRGKSREKT